jgi:hypothetical protein
MQKRLLAGLLSLAFSALVGAQPPIVSERQEAEKKAYREELRRAAKEIKQEVRRVLSESERKAEARRIAEEDARKKREAAEEKRRKDDKIAEDDRLKKEREAADRKLWWTAGLGIAAVAIILLMFLRRNQTTPLPMVPMSKEVVTQPVISADLKPEILINPTKSQVEEILKNSTEAKFVSEIPQRGTELDGIRIDCRATRSDTTGNDPWVYVGDDPRKVTWKNYPGKVIEVVRRQRAQAS